MLDKTPWMLGFTSLRFGKHQSLFPTNGSPVSTPCHSARCQLRRIEVYWVSAIRELTKPLRILSKTMRCWKRASDNLRLAATIAAGPKIEFGVVMELLGCPQKKSWVCPNSHQNSMATGKRAFETLEWGLSPKFSVKPSWWWFRPRNSSWPQWLMINNGGSPGKSHDFWIRGHAAVTRAGWSPVRTWERRKVQQNPSGSRDNVHENSSFLPLDIRIYQAVLQMFLPILRKNAALAGNRQWFFQGSSLHISPYLSNVHRRIFWPGGFRSFELRPWNLCLSQGYGDDNFLHRFTIPKKRRDLRSWWASSRY